MTNEDGLTELRSSLEADGYRVDVAEAGDRVEVAISATPDACPDCLVPKPLMLGFLEQALGVSEQAIDLTYPNEQDDPAGSAGYGG